MLALALFFITENVLAYNEPNHCLITQRAIDLLNHRFGLDYITEAETNAILKGNSSEDAFGHKWLIRLWNQHFFNPLKPRQLWERNKSIDVRFERIADRCVARATASDFFFRVGEVVHHIQDATNPAHVVPVYHGGPLKDKFDEQLITNYLPETVALDTVTTYPAPFTLSILKPVAVRTLDNVKQPFVIQVAHHNAVSAKTIDWSYFWQENATAWFGAYGLLGAPTSDKPRKKIDNYWNTEIRHGDTSYSIDKRDYERFSSQQLEVAVRHTANFIRYAKTLHGRP
ncbi:hypothetical protein GCM10023186_17310 [Hymenobacter koreensis]|uniref:S1/P1 Nuclease n=2 Tax=Hymenobacter koreensis TaxID=1084523 RepID=A0ABP8IY28_9BACT